MADKHRWSGWPGAWCLKCGIGDPMEYAIGNSYYDPYTNTWQDSEEARQAKKECGDLAFCTVPDTKEG